MGAPVLSSSGQPLVIAVSPGPYVKWEETGVWVSAFKAMEAPSRRWELGQSLGDEAAPPWGKPRRDAKSWRRFAAPTLFLLFLAIPHLSLLSFFSFFCFINNNIKNKISKPSTGWAYLWEAAAPVTGTSRS